MALLAQLSSQVGDRTQQSNLKVVARCLAEPALLDEIAAGLTSQDAPLLGDCAEVMTETAETRPDLVAPYIHALIPLLTHKTTRVRWEAMHAIGLVAALRPDVMEGLLPRLRTLMRTDTSVIVRDWATHAVGAYAQTSEHAARLAYPMLTEMLTLWHSKQAGQALRGLANVVRQAPDLAGELHAVAAHYDAIGRHVVRQAARALMKACDQV